MAITNKQRVAIAVIVLVGLLGGAAVLMTERHKSVEGAEHAEGDGHGHDERTGEKRADNDEHKKGGEHKETGKEEHADSVKLTDEQIKAANISVTTAGKARLQPASQFQGEIRFNEDRTAHVVPRLAGVAQSVAVSLGQRVQKGQILAVIASTSLSEQRSELLTAQKRRDLARSTYERERMLWREKISAEQDYLQARSALQEADIAVRNASQKLAAVGAAATSEGLNRFEIRAPFNGTVVEKHLSLGEAVKEDASIFTISDLSTVWAEFAVAPKDLGTVRVGQRVVVSSTAFAGNSEGTISYVGSLLGEQTRTAKARVTLNNPNAAWRPGLFVTVAVLDEDQEVPVAVSAQALQTFEDKPSVFVAVPGGFATRAVKVGRSDGKMVEILDGLKPGEKYAATNSFVLKSELGKDSAGHGH
jgi:membrane fusion protein, heavy metal efflux system